MVELTFDAAAVPFRFGFHLGFQCGSTNAPIAR
jgi:hypothetical protein